MSLMHENQPKIRTRYMQRLTYTGKERLVGAFVLIAVGLLFTALLFNQQTTRLFERKFTLYAYINNAQGINTDTPVVVSGVRVGSVSAIGITPGNRIALTLRILNTYHRLIRVGSHGRLNKLSLLGNTAIEISAGSPQKPMIADGATIPLAEPLSIDQILAQVVPVLEDVKATLARIDAVSSQVSPKAVGNMVHNLAAISANFKSITTQIASGQGAVGKLLYDRKTGANVASAIQALAGTLRQTQASLKSIQPLLRNATAASASLPAVIAQSRKLVTQLNTAMGTVNYQLQALPDLVVRTRQLLDESSQTLHAIQNTWPISASIAKPHQRILTPVRPPDD